MRKKFKHAGKYIQRPKEIMTQPTVQSQANTLESLVASIIQKHYDHIYAELTQYEKMLNEQYKPKEATDAQEVIQEDTN